MTQEEEQKLLVALCGYLPYGVIMRNRECENDFELDGRTELTLTQSIKYSIVKFRAIPYLRSMESMTKIEKEIYKSLKEDIDEDYCEIKQLPLIDWLNTNHFDYRSLIERGLAIEAPKDMYETK